MADVVFVETTTGSAIFTKRKNDPDFRQGPAGSDTNWQGCFVWLWRLILDLISGCLWRMSQNSLHAVPPHYLVEQLPKVIK
ncbi:Inosine-5'-monophosphate dehydrogenase [Fusarium oxysporum f. sp. albedinis]|nr:Inosine-5'-monophosphate dehydrogenase [Fusarium oxysporum f. sp. albedinis]